MSTTKVNRMANYEQDWTPVKIKGQGKGLNTGASKASAKVAPEVAHARKVANAEEPSKPKTLDPSSRQEIVNFRVSKKWTQQEFNTQCAFPINTIREIEAGRLTPSINQLNTLNRIMKTGLKLI